MNGLQEAFEEAAHVVIVVRDDNHQFMKVVTIEQDDQPVRRAKFSFDVVASMPEYELDRRVFEMAREVYHEFLDTFDFNTYWDTEVANDRTNGAST